MLQFPDAERRNPGIIIQNQKYFLIFALFNTGNLRYNGLTDIDFRKSMKGSEGDVSVLLMAFAIIGKR